MMLSEYGLVMMKQVIKLVLLNGSWIQDNCKILEVAIDFGFGTTEEIKAAEAKVRSQMEGLAGLGTFLDTRGIDFAAIREQGDITFGFAEVMKNFNFGIDK